MGRLARPRDRLLASTDPETLTRIVATVIIGLSVVLLTMVYAYSRALRSQRGQALMRAQELAHSVVEEFTLEATGPSWAFLLEAMVPAFRATRTNLESVVDEMDTRAAEFAAACACNAPVPSVIALLDVESRRLAVSRRAPRTSPGAATFAALRAFADSASPDIRRIAAMGVREPSGSLLLHIRVIRSEGGSRILAAVGTPMSQLGSRVFAPAKSRISERLFSTVPVRDSLFSVAVMFAEDELLYRSTQYHSGPSARATYWTSAPPHIEAEVRLNPQLLSSALPGGIPQTRDAELAVLAAVLALLAVGGVLLLRRAQRLVVARTLFLSGVSHEMRTPLTQILMYGEILERESERAHARAHPAHVIVRETRRLMLLVENALLYARTSREGFPLNMTWMPLAVPITECVEDLRPLLAQRETAVELALAADAAANVDPYALRQILVNLLDNAVRYGPRGQIIRVTLSATSGGVDLAIEDQGPGFPPGVNDALLRGSTWVQSATPGTGTGIGLVIVRELVLGMHAAWRIETLRSNGRVTGSKFAIRFPTE